DQDPRLPRHPLARSPPAWRQSCRRLDRQANPPRRPHHLRSFRHSLPPKSAPLRPALAQKPAPAKAGGHGLLQRDGSRYASRYAYRLTPKGVQSLPRRRPGLPGSFSSSTNGCAARSPIAASTTAPTPSTSPPANSKPPTTAPTKPFNRSSISWALDLGDAIVELFLSTILPRRI